MRIPQRFWDVSFSGIGNEHVRRNVQHYLQNLDTHLDAGDGLLFYGQNGTGKTGAAIVIAKEARRRGAPVLFATAEDIRISSIERTPFHEDLTLMDRAREVDLLIIDDLGKDHRGTTGYSDTLFENLIRHRASNVRTTIITTNLDQTRLSSRYKASMMDVVKESMVPVFAEGESLRESKVLAAG
jgi:DNA replication protein DnaC